VIFENMKDKGRCLVAHYFFPAERSVLLEIVPGQDTNPAITDFLMKFYASIGKKPIKVKSRFGYAVDPVFEGLLEAAILIVEKGICTLKQADVISAKALGMGVGIYTAMNLAGGNPITQHGLNEMNFKIMPWYKTPKSLDEVVKANQPWDTPKRGETVEYSQEMYNAVADRMMGAYIGMVAEIVDSGISNIADMELAMKNGLAMTPAFTLMNQIGVKKALELVEAYAKEFAGFKVADILKKQAASGQPWDLPTA
jgi:enoyl-CoA hydratase/3-hydroxyacyl-CoA dehydrogenase